MALRIDIGQYYAADSPVHRMDARAKLLCALAALVAVFCVTNAPQLIAGAAFVLAVLFAARVPGGRVLASVRPLVVFLAVLSLFNLVFVRTGDPLLSLGPVSVTTGGVWAGSVPSSGSAARAAVGQAASVKIRMADKKRPCFRFFIGLNLQFCIG